MTSKVSRSRPLIGHDAQTGMACLIQIVESDSSLLSSAPRIHAVLDEYIALSGLQTVYYLE
jgi:hypothetical protein